MKTVRVLISVVGALVMFVSSVVAQPAPPPSGNTTGVVQVNDVGAFDVYVCSYNITNFRYSFWSGARNPIVTSSTGENTEGRLILCYVDKQSYRDGFSVTLQATDFHSITPGVTGTIEVENLSMYRTSTITRWNTPASHPIPDNEGTLYALTDSQEEPARAADVQDSILMWGPGNTLNVPRAIARADSGRGISLGLELPNNHTYTARQVMFMRLWVPPGTQAATYQTELTIEVNPVVNP